MITRNDFDVLLEERIDKNLGFFISKDTEVENFFTSVSKEDYDGESKLVKKVQTAVTESTAPAYSGEPFGKSGKPKFKKFYYGLKKVQARVVFDGDTVDLKLGKKDFFDTVKDTLKGLIFATSRDRTTYLMGNGTAELAQAAGAAVDQTVTMISSLSLGEGMKLIGVSQTTDLVDAYDVEIEAIDYGTHKVDFIGDVSNVSENTIFYKMGAYNPNFDKAIMGLGGIISDVDPPSGPFQGVSRATNPWMRAIVSDADLTEPTALSQKRFQKVLYALKNNYGQKLPTAGIMSQGVESHLCEWLNSIHQPIETIPTKFGFSGFYYVFNGEKIPLITMKLAPKNTILFPQKEFLKIYNGPAFFWKPNGKVLIPIGDGHGYQAVYFVWQDTLCTTPKGHAKMLNVLENDLSL